MVLGTNEKACGSNGSESSGPNCTDPLGSVVADGHSRDKPTNRRIRQDCDEHRVQHGVGVKSDFLPTRRLHWRLHPSDLCCSRRGVGEASSIESFAPDIRFRFPPPPNKEFQPWHVTL